MVYTASRDPLLIAAVKKAPGTTKGEAPDGREADVVDSQGIVLSCAQGRSTWQLNRGCSTWRQASVTRTFRRGTRTSSPS
ncbi:hypothetical protein NKH18_32215 [Streptomyces sp. M10(2022)]